MLNRRANRLVVDLKTRVVNRAAELVFRKPRNGVERKLHGLLNRVIPNDQLDHMADDMVDADIGFDAEELRRLRGSDQSRNLRN